MNRPIAWLHHISHLLVGGTGLVYFFFKYLISSPTENSWSVVNHPLQPLAQSLHVFVAPFLIFAVGVSFQGHFIKRFKNKTRSWCSGIALALSFVPMVFSGVLLQLATLEIWRQIFIWVHCICSLAWLMAYGIHVFSYLKLYFLKNRENFL